ncbi:MAG: DUF2095 family protein [Promethearchaeota archaeon]
MKEKSKQRSTKEDERQAPKTERPDSETDQWQQFRRRFPHLAAELEASEARVRIDGVRWEETEQIPAAVPSSRGKFTSYSPDPIDFIRRCETKEQALEIIAFLEKRKEINSAYAESLRHQLQTRGLESFGPRKTWGHYERQG